MNRQALALVLVLGLAAGCETKYIFEPEFQTIDYSPAWSPDGESIAFVRGIASQYGPPGIYTIGTDGAGRRLLLATGATRRQLTCYRAP